MKALLLTGGFGTRLRPLTLTRPKHLLPIANRPHMEHVFDLLLRHGIDEVVLLTSYLADAFAVTIDAARARGLAVQVTHEKTPLGTAGAIKNAEALVGDEAFLVFNGDILTDADLGQMTEFHRSRSAEATILLTPVADPSAYGVVPAGPDGRVLGFIEKPPAGEAPTDLINAGIYLFEPRVLDRVPAGHVWSAELQLFPGLVADGAGLFALGTNAYWMDIGTPRKYLDANLDALEGRYSSPSIEAPDAAGVLAAPGARVEDGARVSWSCLGAGVSVQGGATVEGSVLLPEAFVASGAMVARSILGAGVRVEAGAHLVDAAIADGDRVTGGSTNESR
ncbi:MAG: sugar phosphate nucleotidyltransferase [Actinomycetota bacterium]